MLHRVLNLFRVSIQKRLLENEGFYIGKGETFAECVDPVVSGDRGVCLEYIEVTWDN